MAGGLTLINPKSHARSYRASRSLFLLSEAKVDAGSGRGATVVRTSTFSSASTLLCRVFSYRVDVRGGATVLRCAKPYDYFLNVDYINYTRLTKSSATPCVARYDQSRACEAKKVDAGGGLVVMVLLLPIQEYVIEQ